ncbi:tyrosine-type recombinase/integrase [Jiangella endophytica]|uniref:tyrosine-type recombinase/integrase n=1 Tax=Jiangella endophytica TaxID=1623398 RepID=UPI000E34E2F6|nr:tyrosine-type recombinase/integrase [Jiangella endophytica]
MAELLEDLFKSFRRDLRAADKAERTITIYHQSVRFFSEWLTAQGRPATKDELTRSAIAAWLADLADSGMATNTLSTRFRGLRRFCRWLVVEDELERSPMEGLEQPKAAAKPVPVLPDAEVTALFKACGGTSFTDRRDTAILRVLFDCGVRISECARLGVDDLDLDDYEVIRVVGKGRKERVVPFGPKTGRALDRYLRMRRQHPHAHSPGLFLGKRGALTADGIDDRLRRLAERAGLDHLHAHQFRHSLAHNWLATGGQEQDLKRIMGWTSDAMLAVYGQSAADERARQAFRAKRLGDRL